MSRLKMITQADPKPRDINSAQIKSLPKVYFAAHPKDHKECLDRVAEEIFRTHNCAICYDTQPKTPYDELVLGDLENMSLFVMPITRRLLTDPVQRRVLEQDLPLAEAHNIPILPLMQEDGLDTLYGKVEQLKDRQALNPHAQDQTALAYTDKLKSFLDGVLLDQKELSLIQEAFQAKIFLSYRKKNRLSARELMHTIHQDPLLRDVAIWYDEFLTFGEDFNDEICKTIGQSDLFMLAVTPDLMENGNYVIRYEYPAALNERKPILPVLAEKEKTVQATFRQTFLMSEEEDTRRKIKASVRDMVDADGVCNAVKDILYTQGKVLTEDHRPIQEYLMGRAYLNGIDVERDVPRAVSLLKASAEGGFPAAMIELRRMYKFGHGVKKSIDSALWWARGAAQWFWDEYRKTGKEDLFKKACDIQLDMVYDMCQTTDPLYWTQANLICEQLLEEYQKRYTPEDVPALFAKLYMHWSLALFECNPQYYARGMQCLEQGLHYQMLYYLAEDQSPEARNALLEQHIIGAAGCLNLQHKTEALRLLQQGQKLCGTAWDTEDDAEFLQLKAALLSYQGIITKDLTCLEMSLALHQSLEKHKPNSKASYLKADVSAKAADAVFRKKNDSSGRNAETRKYLCQAEQYARDFLQQEKSAKAVDLLCMVLCEQVRLYSQMGANGKEWLQEAYDRLEKDILPASVKPQEHLKNAYRMLGQKWEDLGDAADSQHANSCYKKSEYYYSESLTLFQALPDDQQENIIGCSELYRCLGRIYAKQNNGQLAIEHMEEGLHTVETFAAKHRRSDKDWKAFLKDKDGKELMDHYTHCCLNSTIQWRKYGKENPNYIVWQKTLLEKGLAWAQEWKLAAPTSNVYWRIITLLALQEDLSWTTKDFSCGYRCNQSILELFKLMQDKKISEEQRFLELQATLSMGQQIQLGVESKTPAKTYFNKAEILAKRWLKIQGSPQKRCQTAKTIDEMIFAANRRYPTKESLALLQELRKITQRT